MPVTRNNVKMVVDGHEIALPHPCTQNEAHCEICETDKEYLGGLDDNRALHALCPDCAHKYKVTVCAGSCERWHRLINVNESFLCQTCAGATTPVTTQETSDGTATQ